MGQQFSLTLNVAIVLLMAKPDMTDFILDKAGGDYPEIQEPESKLFHQSNE
jgi:hypothetical protein